MKQKKSGSISAYSLLILAVILVASGSAVTVSYTSMAKARSDMRASASYCTAQSALELALTSAYNDAVANKGSFKSRDNDVSSDLKGLVQDLSAASIEVEPVNGGGSAWVTSKVTVDGRTTSVRSYVRAKDVGIWNNAIFAGSGASGQAINGNVDIRGSVHILGDGEPFIDTNGNSKWDPAEAYVDKNKNGKYDLGEPFTDSDNNGIYTPAEPFNDVNGNGAYDPPMTETDLNTALSGTAGIFNHYAGMPMGLLMRIPSPPTLGGIQTLSAELRVKNGMVGLSGSASVGNSSVVNGGSAKQTVDGTFVSAGFSGNQGAASVYSDNGAKNGYDLGALGIKYPLITGIGADKYIDKDKVTWTTQKEFLDARSLSIPVTTVVSTTPAFSYGPDAYGNSISFTPAGKGGVPSAKLTINGIVKVPDGFQLGTKDSISYDGSGTLYCPGSMKIDGNVLPIDGRIFPTTARMGFIAKQDILLACGNGSAQLDLAGAFYAQGKIKSAKQNQVLGTFVGSYFDLGTNVPSIYQVPDLAKNLPPGMPGDQPYISLRKDSWRVRND